MKLLKIYIFLTFSFSIVCFQSYSQLIGGKVVQVHDQKSIPYTTLAIEGTTLGIVTDFDGNFVLEIPNEHLNKTIIVSCVGYKDRILNIQSNIGRLDLLIELEALNVEIEEVVVEQTSLLPYSIIKKAVDALRINYLNMPHNYEYYYKNTDSYYKNEDKVREALVKIYDSKGYGESSIIESFKEINYRFLHSKRNFEVNDINSANTNLDNMLEFDIMRHQSNITDKRRVYDFDIVIKDEIMYKGDSVWVLSYQCKSPDLIRTGDFSVESYIGELFVNKKNYAVLYNTTTVISKNPSILSRNLYAKTYYKIENLNYAKYTFEIIYEKKGTKYMPEKIEYEINYEYDSKKDNVLLSSESELRLLDSNNSKPEVIELRDYYENLDYNPEFWSQFNY
jgi:hypothetical protein